MKMTWLLTLLVSWLLFVSPVQAVPDTIDINQATAESLAAGLKGIGLEKATAIIEYRDKNGPFKSVEDLTLVKGIGWKTIEANRNRIRLSNEETKVTGDADSTAQGKMQRSAGPK